MQAFLRLHAATPTDRDLWWVHQNAALSALAASDDAQVQRLDVSGFLGPPATDPPAAMLAMPHDPCRLAGSMAR